MVAAIETTRTYVLYYRYSNNLSKKSLHSAIGCSGGGELTLLSSTLPTKKEEEEEGATVE
jgi:hypothetical protein